MSQSRQPQVPLAIRLLVALAATLGCMAAVPGDIGGCGQDAEQLDPEGFFLNKKRIDCEQCERCGLTSRSCLLACDAEDPVPTEFPDGCVPLVHDGEVCLNALDAASCRAYERFVSDTDPEVPTECDFCPVREAP
jgi:hypothetical protein